MSIKDKVVAAGLGSVVALVSRPWLRRLGKFKGKAQLNETDLLVAVCEALDLRGVMVDVGARYGTSLAPFVRNGWQVLAFEPDPANREVLECLRFWRRDVRLDPRALSDESVSGATLFTSAGRTSISSLLPFDASHAPSVKVDVITLETAMREHGVSEIQVLKVDAEGNDLRVLKGLDLEGSLRPTVIMCEFDGRKVSSGGHTYEDLSHFLHSAGYEIVVSEWHPLEEYGGDHRWRGVGWYPDASAAPASHGNLIAIDQRRGAGREVRDTVDSWAARMRADRAQ